MSPQAAAEFGDRAGRGRRAGRLGPRGQATVELVALLPLLVLVGLACAQALAAGLAREAAHHAAEAGAVAILEGGRAAQQARAAAPDWSRDRLHVAVAGRSVRVRVDPPVLLPGLAGLLTAEAAASAGTGP